MPTGGTGQLLSLAGETASLGHLLDPSMERSFLHQNFLSSPGNKSLAELFSNEWYISVALNVRQAILPLFHMNYKVFVRVQSFD